MGASNCVKGNKSFLEHAKQGDVGSSVVVQGITSVGNSVERCASKGGAGARVTSWAAIRRFSCVGRTTQVPYFDTMWEIIHW